MMYKYHDGQLSHMLWWYRLWQGTFTLIIHLLFIPLLQMLVRHCANRWLIRYPNPTSVWCVSCTKRYWPKRSCQVAARTCHVLSPRSVYCRKFSARQGTIAQPVLDRAVEISSSSSQPGYLFPTLLSTMAMLRKKIYNWCGNFPLCSTLLWMVLHAVEYELR